MKSMTPRSCKSLLQYLIARQFTFLDRFVNSRQVLVNDSTRSQVQVANFRVAHLSLWQTDVNATGAQSGAWIIPVEFVVKGSGREQRGVSILVALVPPAWIDAPAVANDEHHRASHTPRILPMNEKIDKRFQAVAG